MDLALSTVRWVVGKALAPVVDGLLEDWAASRELGPNIDALKTELLYTQATLETARDKQLDGPALQELLRKLQDSAHSADNLLDELDYFRIRDKLRGTYEAADEHAKGGVYDLVLNAHHTSKSVGSRLAPSAAVAGAIHHASSSSAPTVKKVADEEIARRSWKFSKLFPFLCFPSFHEDGDDNGKSVVPFGASEHKEPQENYAPETPKLGFNRVDISKRMKQIVDQLQPLRKEVTTILQGCNPSSTVPAIARSRPITTSESTEPKVYGRDHTVKSIIDDMTKGKYCGANLTVLPIVGPGGIGKTTMIQHICHNQQVQSHFEVVVWVCVSLNFNPNKLLEEIRGYIPPVQGVTWGTATELIEQRLKSKRFLLILDDMWECSDEDDWRKLLLPFRKSQEQGNMVLVTTRLLAVAEMVKTTDHPIKLGGLEPKDFKILFQAFVFGDEQCSRENSFLLETGEKIMKKLKGSPLAAKTVGRLLRKHLDLRHWRMVLQSKEWEMQTSDHDIMPALKLSYDHLPFHLQQCFFYCALFPEDYKFDSKELIHLWIGLDILRPNGRTKSLEDIGMSNLDDLVTHGFFKKDEIDGKTYYVIHDLLHDLALKVASHECLSLHCFNIRTVEIKPCIHHLSIVMGSLDAGNKDVVSENFKRELRKLKNTLKVEGLQTLMLFGEMDESFTTIFSDLFGEANAFRVLHLPNMSDPVESILNFPALIHLRYLSLGTIPRSKMHLPNTISRFYHLRILNLEAWHGCFDSLKDMSNLEKLCHFVTQHDELHSDISDVGKLKLLQELKVFKVNKEAEGFEPNQLEHLVELRELGIYNLEKIRTNEEAAQAKLVDKNYLQRLKLDWDHKGHSTDAYVESGVLENLQPPVNLQELCIGGHKGRSCPTWLGDDLSVEALQSLYLIGVSWEALPSFERFCDLRELTLKYIATIKEFVLDQTFCKLTRLELVGLRFLEKWVAEDNHFFPLLLELKIIDCDILSKLPFSNHQDSNRDMFPRLEGLQICSCPVSPVPPVPWVQSLCRVYIRDVASKIVRDLFSYDSSYGYKMSLLGYNDLISLDQVLVFSKLTELQRLNLNTCPPLEFKHLLMLTSLKKLSVENSGGLVVPLSGQGHVQRQLPIEDVKLKNFGAAGVTWLLRHLPRLSTLKLTCCPKIARLIVEVDLQQTIEGTQGKDEKRQVAEEEEEAEDGLLVLPAQLANTLQMLKITCGSRTPRLTVHSLCALQTLRSLKFKSLDMVFSSCFPFPSSLQYLSLKYVTGLQSLEALSNLLSLTRLRVQNCGISLRCQGKLPLLARGQLREFKIRSSEKSLVGWELQYEEEQLFPSSKLQKLNTDEMTGVLTKSLCSLVSSSLTSLQFCGDEEVHHFTKQQEEALHCLTSLKELKFVSCSELQCLPEGLNKLTKLTSLQVSWCPFIYSLPKDGLPSSLQVLDVLWCNNEELALQCRQLVGTIPEIIL